MNDSVHSPRIGLSLLGRFELRTRDGLASLRGRKLAGLLAYLACTAPRPQSRDKLATLLWGSHFDVQAKQNLRQALFRIRQVLGDHAIESDTDAVWLHTPMIDCDVDRFEALLREGSREALHSAADLYRGRFLDDVAIGEEGWSEWLASERERLQELALGGLVRLGELDLAAGRAADALRSGQRANALNNMREDAHRLVVKALVATGRKAEALKYYRDVIGLLKRELDTEPDAATKSLVAELRGTQMPVASDRPQAHVAPPGDSSDSGRLVADGRGSGVPEPGIEVAPVGGARAAGRERLPAIEQRQLTVLACSVANSPVLSADLDPEDIHDLVAGFHRRVADISARFGGFVAHYQGYGALVYFGYPIADEYAAERAVRAALAIAGAGEGLDDAAAGDIGACIGIATGPVIVGGETDRSGQRVAIGETPDAAMRLQAVARPRDVVIADGTRRLVGRAFDCRALPPSAGPQSSPAWRVHGEVAGMSRFSARRGDAPSRLVGRQDEMALLLRRWDQAQRGEGRVVIISGEPGIGKSHIAESVLAALQAGPRACLRYFCSPHHAHSALHPFMARIGRDAGFAPGDSAGARLDKLEAWLAPTTPDLGRDLPLFAELLAIPLDGRYPAPAASPPQKRTMVLAALFDQLDRAAAQGPLLIVLEDAHWIDPTSLDLVDRIVARLARMPVLLLVTARPEAAFGWVDQPHVTSMPLNRLGPGDSAGIMRGIAGETALPDVVVAEIVARADGVPLFIEELTSALIESGLLRKTAAGYVLDGSLPPLAVPTTLQASLVARLDLLGAARDVAMAGAAIGREFSGALIAAVAALDPPDLDASLARLTASGLVTRRGRPPDVHYAFKHALIRDAAYTSMVKSRRRQLHGDIARALVGHFPALVENQPEIVAGHFTEAGLAGEAVSHWVKAGRRAQASWANREAVRFFEEALRVLGTQPETREALRQAIDLRFELKTALLPLGRFEPVLAHLREAEALAKRIDDRHRLAEFSYHMCQILAMSGDPAEAAAFGRQALTLAEDLGDVRLQVAANLFLGTACFLTLDYRQVERLFARVLELLDGAQISERFGLAGFPAVTAHAFLTRILAEQGRFDEGVAHGQAGIRIAEAVNDPYSLGIASWCLADLHIIRGELADAMVLLERGLAVARERDLPFLVAGNSGSLGSALSLLGRVAEGLPMLEAAVGAFEAMGHRFSQFLFFVPLGEAYRRAGRHADAFDYADRALTAARHSGQGRGEASALHLLGEITIRTGPAEQAEGHFRAALALAERLGMRPLAARCHRGLADLCRLLGRLDQAQDHLTAVKALCGEMGMSFRPEAAGDASEPIATMGESQRKDFLAARGRG